ncbi:hypothetical protein ACHQM5_030101 [Ranunculus cassubicifolius]
MGMMLKHAVDPLAILTPNFNIYGVNNSDFSVKNNILKNTLTGDSMDRRLEQFNRESVRMTILKHDEIFKEQVKELHRVYRVQKKLMAELRNNASNIHAPANQIEQRTTKFGNRCIDREDLAEFWNGASTSETNQAPFTSWNHSSTNKANMGYNFHPLFSTRDVPHLQEQSGSCSRDASKTHKGFDLEQPVEEISTNIKDYADSSSDPGINKDGECEVELTLSIGFGTSKKKSNNRKTFENRELGCSSSNNLERRHFVPSLLVRTDRGEECSNLINSTGSDTATCDRDELQRPPPWIFQALSLDRT